MVSAICIILYAVTFILTFWRAKWHSTTVKILYNSFIRNIGILVFFYLHTSFIVENQEIFLFAIFREIYQNFIDFVVDLVTFTLFAFNIFPFWRYKLLYTRI